MKKLAFYIVIIVTVGLSACKKDLTDRFYNPDALSQGVADPVPGLFTSTLINVYQNIDDYFEWYYAINASLGMQGYDQTCSRYTSTRYAWFSTYSDLVNGNGFSDQGETQIGGHIAFEQTYIDLKSWGIIKDLRNQRSGTDKVDADMYFKIVSIIKDVQAAKLVDLSNSVPYFNAYQGSYGGAANYFPVYDDPQKIYEAIITDLGNIVDSLPLTYSQMSILGKGTFQAQDIAFAGNANTWAQYANAVRVKLLVRIMDVDAAFAKPLLIAALTKPLPTQDLYWNTPTPTDLINGITWQRGVHEQPYASFIPNIMMRRMNYGTSFYEPGIDDPRLPVIAMPTYHHDYSGISYNLDAQTILYSSGEKYYPYADNINLSLSPTAVGYGNGGNAKSMYSHVTFINNSNLPVYMFTLAEMDLLMAEIELKGYAATGEPAADHIKDEVVHSTSFWYALNQKSTYPQIPLNNSAAENTYTHTFDTLLHPTLPSASIIATYANTVKTKFLAASGVENQMEILMQQKYIHLNIMQRQEVWTELRRTRHPYLEPLTNLGVVMKPMPERIHYPQSENVNNQANFQKVAAQNNNTSQIFWVPASRSQIIPYWNDYNYQ